MAADDALVQSVACGEAPPTFRVFGWRPPAVSFGYAQRITREVDPQKCRQRGMDIVRRPTGGRAVLHWNELTYSVVCSADHPLLGGTVQEAYRKISRCLVAGIKRLGARVQLETGRQIQPSPRGKPLTSPCFSSTAQYEITLENRKLIGSAQRRMNNMLLQHGSILLGPEHQQIVDLMPAGKEALQARFRQELETQTTSLEQALNRPVSFEETADALRQGMCETLGIALIDTPLTPQEVALAERLVTQKYGTAAWNFTDHPKTVRQRL